VLVNLGPYTDCPVFDGLYEFCQLYTGGSIGRTKKRERKREKEREREREKGERKEREREREREREKYRWCHASQPWPGGCCSELGRRYDVICVQNACM